MSTNPATRTHAEVRMHEEEELIIRYESAALDLMRRARGTENAFLALGLRDQACDQLLLAVEHTRRLCALHDQQRRQMEASQPKPDPDETA